MSLPYVSALKKRKADVRERFLGASRHLKARKSCHKSPVEQLNNALDEWMNRMERQNAPVSDLVLTTKARQLGEGMQLPKSFKYSKMWLLNYKRSRGMTSKVLQFPTSLVRGFFNGMAIPSRAPTIFKILWSFRLAKP
eukprot:344518-Prorocentrum_lima.AAC.1